MVKIEFLKEHLLNGDYDEQLAKIYVSNTKVELQKQRYSNLIESFISLFGAGREIGIYSAPGRTEVCGNHTDHNHGKVLAASIDLDAIAVAAKSPNNTIRIKSEGFEQDAICLDDLEINKEEYGTSLSIVKGLCFRFQQLGYNIGGFDACVVSDVLVGSGLSSSAAFEVLIGTILNYLYNEGKIPAPEIAKISQYAENMYFGKPSGLMDQMTSAVGGFVAIDFKDSNEPVIEKVRFDFSTCNHALCIVDTGGSHADLTEDYAAVRKEMEVSAKVLGGKYLREVCETEFMKNISNIRETAGDRAVLRGMHFFAENKRVASEVEALNQGDFETFKNLIKESGRSSYMYNQNVFTCKNVQEQPVSIALAISEKILGDKGAWRVHGGGFAGTIQAFVPVELLSEYKTKMESVFGQGSCYVLAIRPVGCTAVIG